MIYTHNVNKDLVAAPTFMSEPIGRGMEQEGHSELRKQNIEQFDYYDRFLWRCCFLSSFFSIVTLHLCNLIRQNLLFINSFQRLFKNFAIKKV